MRHVAANNISFHWNIVHIKTYSYLSDQAFQQPQQMEYMNATPSYIGERMCAGVCFRYVVRKTAQKLALTGWIANLSDGDVLLEA